MQIPPRSAILSSRAATLTPSPKMSVPSQMIAPRLMPNAKFDALVRRYRRIAFEHAALNLDGTSNAALCELLWMFRRLCLCAQNSVSRKQRLRFEETRFECRYPLVRLNRFPGTVLASPGRDRSRA